MNDLRSVWCGSDDPNVHASCERDETTCNCGCHRYVADLRGAYERLCRASTWAPDHPDLNLLQGAIDRIALAGHDQPGWSEHVRRDTVVRGLSK